MSLLPPSTNEQYRGPMIAPAGLGLIALLTVGPGLIHYLLPDGGAGVIAHIDLSTHRAVIIGVFAWMGATQIAWGLAMLAVALRYRSLTSLFLLLALGLNILSALAAWVTKGSASGHHPPENYAVIVLIAVIGVLLPLSLRETR